MSWDDYEEILLRALPQPCRRALDVGCGHGRFARRLAESVIQVDALDRVDLGVDGPPNVRFIQADFLRHPIEHEAYDFVCAIASLHHLPLTDAIERMKKALRPGGVLGVIGLFRDGSATDFLWSAAAFPISRYLRLTRGRAGNRAPLRDPSMTLPEIRTAVARLLPGAAVERHLLWRYTLIWTKPS
jgi:SAM-dependent methyltransferase